MRITISGKNIDVTQGLKDAVYEKLGKLEKYFYSRNGSDCNTQCGKESPEDRSYCTGKRKRYSC